MRPHITSHREPCSCFPKKVSLQPLSSHITKSDVAIDTLYITEAQRTISLRPEHFRTDKTSNR